MIERRILREGIYQQLGWTAAPEPGMAVCPVLHGGRLIGLQPKLDPAGMELGSLRTGTDWRPIRLPDNLAGPMGVFICKDFMHRTSDVHQDVQVDAQLQQCRFLAVASLTPLHSVEEFAAKAREQARRHGRPVLYTNSAPGGGTTIFCDSERKPGRSGIPHAAGILGPGEEGVVVADIDLGMTSAGRSTRYTLDEAVKPYATASLVYQHTSVGRDYAEWLQGMAPALAGDGFEALEAVSARVMASRETLRAAGDQVGAGNRLRRLRRLRTDDGRTNSMEEYRRSLREIVMPADALPLSVLQAALCRGAGRQLWSWMDAHKEPELGVMAKALEEQASKLLAKQVLLERIENQVVAAIARAHLTGEPDEPNAPSAIERAVPRLSSAVQPTPTAAASAQSARGIDAFGARVGSKRATMNALFQRPGGASRDDIALAMMAAPHNLPASRVRAEFASHVRWMRKSGWVVETLADGNVRFANRKTAAPS